MIPDETVEQVRDSADIVGLIGESVELKRTGSDYRGPCPFHGGTHRNFLSHSQERPVLLLCVPRVGRRLFLAHEALGMDYPGAVREVARRSGIVIPERPGRSGPDPHEPLYGAVAAAHDWFARQLLELPDARIARDYLQSRDIPLDTAALLGLGFAPSAPAFLKAMADLGIEEPVLIASALRCSATTAE